MTVRVGYLLYITVASYSLIQVPFLSNRERQVCVTQPVHAHVEEGGFTPRTMVWYKKGLELVMFVIEHLLAFVFELWCLQHTGARSRWAIICSIFQTENNRRFFCPSGWDDEHRWGNVNLRAGCPVPPQVWEGEDWGAVSPVWRQNGMLCQRWEGAVCEGGDPGQGGRQSHCEDGGW